MQMLLATLAACDVDLVAMHASFLGIPIESLSVVATGYFNVPYLGLEGAPGSGYDRIAYTVRIVAPGATAGRSPTCARGERSSPVGDSLVRAIPLKLAFEAKRISSPRPGTCATRGREGLRSALLRVSAAGTSP